MSDKTLGAYVRTTPHPDDMDGGITAALIEKEATDPDGDGLSITTQGDQVWITCTGESSEVTVGPIPAGLLTDVLGTGQAYARAAKAEQERDGARSLKQRICELHTSDQDGYCIHCSRGRIYPIPAPCATVRLLEDGDPR